MCPVVAPLRSLLRDEVVALRRRFIVKRPAPPDTLALVAAFYEQARESRLGVVLCGLCRAREDLYVLPGAGC